MICLTKNQDFLNKIKIFFEQIQDFLKIFKEMRCKFDVSLHQTYTFEV